MCCHPMSRLPLALLLPCALFLAACGASPCSRVVAVSVTGLPGEVVLLRASVGLDGKQLRQAHYPTHQPVTHFGETQ